ncbi:unnamed protein product [Notodromas monacha]|uniref:Uncharacterized protein n=1 Tax=Notodromas monacha TaxID=399045 RepID=A0A7R9BKB9_9CRUS|nr:unnamed protein product [Notodromas monacha]CAG0915969.1 unnamed protein product [Notodromas monacha]
MWRKMAENPGDRKDVPRGFWNQSFHYWLQRFKEKGGSSQEQPRRRSTDSSNSPAPTRRSSSRQQMPPPPVTPTLTSKQPDYGSLDRVVRRKDKTTVISVRPVAHQPPQQQPSFDFCSSLDRRKRSLEQFGEPLKASSPIQRRPTTAGSSSSKSRLNESSDAGIDPRKIQQDGDEYKIVFISSDSSRDSEFNTSVDEENAKSQHSHSLNSIGGAVQPLK